MDNDDPEVKTLIIFNYQNRELNDFKISMPELGFDFKKDHMYDLIMTHISDENTMIKLFNLKDYKESYNPIPSIPAHGAHAVEFKLIAYNHANLIEITHDKNGLMKITIMVLVLFGVLAIGVCIMYYS